MPLNLLVPFSQVRTVAAECDLLRRRRLHDPRPDRPLPAPRRRLGMFTFLTSLFASETPPASLPSLAAPPNTLECEESDAEDRSEWGPLATAIAVNKLYHVREQQVEEFLIENYGCWTEKLLLRLKTRKRKRI